MQIRSKNSNSEVTEPEDNKKNVQKLPEKVFVARNSLLTDLFENKHIATIYHVFGAILVGLFLNTVFYDYLKHQRLHFGFRLIVNGFGKFHWAFLLWLFLLFLVFCTYVCFNIWANVRSKLTSTSLALKLWDRTWIIVLVFYYFYSYYWMLKQVSIYKLPPCSACCLVTEYTRMIMKTHSFVRYNTSKVLKLSSSAKKAVPSFTKYAYFLFAPTLIYRDEYPRTTHIRWKFVIVCFLEIIMIIFYLSFIIERFLAPPYQNFCLNKYAWTDIVLSFFANAFAGIMFLILTFYAVLHCTQNIFAELLTFADRMFYSDWWTSTTLPRWYRTWNVIVHDWLYAYIYRDMLEFVFPKKIFLAKFMVFFISAIVHEIMLTFILNMFCPILFLEFISIGFVFYFIKGPKHGISNIFMLYGIAQGAGIQLSIYCLEFYARYNFPMDNKSVWDFITLRSLACVK